MDDLPIEVSCEVVKVKLDGGEDLFLLDCREPSEHEIVSIDGAVLLPMGEIQDRIGELVAHQSRHVVVHCHLGGRSLQVAAWLRQQGFGQAQSMTGGIDRWAQEVEPGLARY